MKKFFRKFVLILPVFIAFSGCSKSSKVNDDNTNKQVVRKASKEVEKFVDIIMRMIHKLF
ncbi:putative lipoprotein [Parvimonas sp. oral taxon 393 str. F0440]|nr:putative lipoprotein [Parvimonas sp. oral taxon 393 str. F0440]